MPNNGLGIEYCKAILEDGQIKQVKASLRLAGVSASEIRKQIKDSAEKSDKTADLNAYSEIFNYLLLRDAPLETPDMTADLANRFRSHAGKHPTLADLLHAVKTKRYTYTRLQRAVIHAVLGITREDMQAFEKAGGAQYIRVLGFRKESEGLLGEMTRRATLPVVTSTAKARGYLSALGVKMLEKEAEAARLHGLAYGSAKNDCATPMVIV
jgi:predicted nucleotidyltransferase